MSGAVNSRGPDGRLPPFHSAIVPPNRSAYAPDPMPPTDLEHHAARLELGGLESEKRRVLRLGGRGSCRATENARAQHIRSLDRERPEYLGFVGSSGREHGDEMPALDRLRRPRLDIADRLRALERAA